MQRLVLLLLLCLSLCAELIAQNGMKVSTEEELMTNVKSAVCKNADRLESVKKLFKDLGAADDEIKIEKFKDIQNIVVTKKGKTDNTIIIGAHYD